MFAVVAIAALALLFVASKVASSRTTVVRTMTPSQAARPGAAIVVPPPPPGPGQVATIAPAVPATAPTSGGPPGLLLRREPEIRGLPSEALHDYLVTVDRWLAAGGVPTPAWVTSREQASTELLLRGRVRRSTGDLTAAQMRSLTEWLLRLQAAGMSIDSDEQGLLLNLQEEARWRLSQGEGVEGTSGLAQQQQEG